MKKLILLALISLLALNIAQAQPPAAWPNAIRLGSGFSVELCLDDPQQVYVELQTATAEVLHRVRLSAGQGPVRVELPTQGLPKGVYFVLTVVGGQSCLEQLLIA